MTSLEIGHGIDGAVDYARLPEDLLAELLAQTPTVVRQVRELLGPALAARDDLRRAAERTGLINEHERGRAGSICAVDGGFAVERTIAVDLILAVAVGVEGFLGDGGGTGWNDNQYASFHRVLPHHLDNERLARASMVAHELAVLADSPHDVAIYDGSHLTPVIGLNSGLTSGSDQVSELSVAVAADVDLESAFHRFVEHPSIVAMPKYDSSDDLCRLLGAALGTTISGDDKYVTSLILRGGEYTTPQQVRPDPWRELHITTRPGTPAELSGLPARFDALLQPLRDRQLYYVYWRPDDAAPSYRLEVKPPLAHDREALRYVLSTLAWQITGPFVREPYPQYLADVMAKSVGLGLGALQAAAHLALSRAQPELAEYLVRSYRTEGK